ncbi:MAG: hypothetical protein WKF70_08435 [Chitinophagaceae bacterium]
MALKNISLLLSQLEQLKEHIPNQAATRDTVSKSSVGWHIEHTLLTINQVIAAVKRSSPRDYKWTFSFLRWVILTTRKIPRGRGQSPSSVQPGAFNFQTLNTHAYVTGEQIKELPVIREDKFFEHPFFGKLRLKATVRFLEIHTQHHLHIIHDILQTSVKL